LWDELRYKSLLQQLFKDFGSKDFDIEKAFQRINPILAHMWGASGYSAYETAMTKRLSNDLNRLYRMTFLTRKRAKREVTTRRGLKCNRGYKYVYRISSQGRSYVNYLYNPESSLSRRQEMDKIDFLDRLSIERLRQQLPSGVKPYARRLHDALFQSKPSSPIDLRFPIPHDPSLFLLLNRYIKENDALTRIAREAVELAKEAQKSKGSG
jgi:hypothetical protein